MDFLEWLTEKFSDIWGNIINYLPKSPITWLTSNPTIDKYMGYVNWFIPVYLWVGILEAWLVAIGAYYIYQIILRWVNAIE